MADLRTFGINYSSRAEVTNQPRVRSSVSALDIFRAPTFATKTGLFRWAKIVRRSPLRALIFVRIGRPRLISAISNGIGEAALESWINLNIGSLVNSLNSRIKNEAPVGESGDLLSSIYSRTHTTKVPRWHRNQSVAGWSGSGNENKVASKLRYAQYVERNQKFFFAGFRSIRNNLRVSRTFLFKFRLRYAVSVSIRTAAGPVRTSTIFFNFNRSRIVTVRLRDFISLIYEPFDKIQQETKVTVASPSTFLVDLRRRTR